MTLEAAVQNIYNVMFTPDKGIGLFSSKTAQSLAETIESIDARESIDEQVDETKFDYDLTFTITPMGELYREYCNNIFTNNSLDINTKVFQVYLYPLYLEALVNASFAVLNTDGIAALADYVHSVMEVGHNQFVNMYCLRNKIETLEAQNQFLLSEIEKAIDLNYKEIEKLENFNFTELSSEFLGWTDNFPVRLLNYVVNLDSYSNRALGIADQEMIDKITNDLLDIAINTNIFTVELKRV